MKKNERLDALNVLMNVIDYSTPLLHAMQTTNVLSPFSKALCFGVCRHYYRLEALADMLVSKRPKQTDIWLCLLMGLYQLHFLRLADYAVVKETVNLLSPIKKSWAKGLVNAVLRRYCREEQTILENINKNNTFLYGHPEWLIARIKRHWPDHWQSILHANDEHPPMSLRINNTKTTRDDYLARLQEHQIEAYANQYSKSGITLTTACDVQHLPGFAMGDVSVQDEAAQLATTLLTLAPGLRVLDACCAPGGKTCHILEQEAHLDACVALDIEQGRLKRVQENLNRLSLSATLICGDGRHPEAWWDGQLFDRILLDAPCSATGVIRRHPDIKLLRTEANIKQATEMQRELLHSLWPLLAPSGILVYATCSIMPEENEQQISAFIDSTADCQHVTTPLSWAHATGHGFQVLPGEHNMDGFFYSVLQKISEQASNH
jgi:16S rRNA (cytosine967-C5)-methyltransferase